MKSHLFILLVTVGLCSATSPANIDLQSATDYECIQKAYAEQILGQSATRVENTSTKEAGVVQYKCTYTCLGNDPATNKTGNLYYMYEEYNSTSLAKQTYDNIVASNQQMSGHSKLNDIGDDAWFHTDQENFYLIIFRKQNKMVRIKINKVTSLTSKEALLRISNSIALTM